MADAVQLAESYDRMAVIRCVEQSLSWVNELPCWPLFAFQRHSICVADDVSSVVQRRLANSALKCHGTHVLSRCGGAVVADAAREHVGCVVCGPCSGSLRMSEFNLNAPFGSTWCFFPLEPLLSVVLSAGLTRVELSVQPAMWSFTRPTRKYGCLWSESNAAGVTAAKHGDPSGLSPGHNNLLGCAWGGICLTSNALT